MSAKGFTDPATALARIVDILLPVCVTGDDGKEPIVHTGSYNSGATIDCCTGACVLRVEEVDITPVDGEVSLRRPCRQLRMDVDVIYSQCFMSNTKSGRARAPEDLTEDGMELVTSGWDALEKLKCPEFPYNDWIKFVSLSTDGPEGNCAGWSMRLAVDIKFCDPCSPPS